MTETPDAVAASVVIAVKEIPLSMILPSPKNPRKTFDKNGLKELGESLKKDGQLQDISVRQTSVNPDMYELIYGERRFQAAKLAGIETLIAKIMVADDEQVERMQFIENLKREDVHAMEEAEKFGEMMNRETAKYTLEDLCRMINKKPFYVVQRLELLKLIPDIKKDFRNNLLGLSMAFLFARLTPAEQKAARQRSYISEIKRYGSESSLIEWIQRNVMMDLSKARFDKTDPNLNPKMGACTTCPKRSGANILFEDVKNKDICMMAECFKLKNYNHTIAMIDNVLVKHPDIVFAKQGYSSIDDDIVKKLNGFQIISTYDNGYSSSKSNGGEQLKVMMVSGDNIGQITTVYKVGSSKKKPDVKEMQKTGAKTETLLSAVKENIAGIETRQARMLELDAEKIWERIRKEVIENSTSIVHNALLTQIELGGVCVAMLEGMSYGGEQKKARALLFGESKGHTRKDVIKGEMEKVMKVDWPVFYEISRLFILEKLNRSSGSHLTGIDQAVVKTMAEQHHAEAIAKIQADQDAIAEKRIERAKERLADFQKEKKALEAKIKTSPVKAEKKPAKGKAASKKKEKSIAEEIEEEDLAAMDDQNGMEDDDE